MMLFQWDANNEAHVARHAATPEEAEEVLLGNPLETHAYTRNGEDRFGFVGPTNAGRMLFVVVTPRGDAIRVITAYPARRNQRAEYKKYLKETQ